MAALAHTPVLPEAGLAGAVSAHSRRSPRRAGSPWLDSAPRCSANVLMQIDTLSDALAAGWRVHARCPRGNRGQHALNGQMPLSGGAKPRNACLDARSQYAARRVARADDVSALREPPRQFDIRSAACSDP